MTRKLANPIVFGPKSAQLFWAKVQRGEGCWEWQGCLRGGYGIVTISQTSHNAHRVAYTLLRGPVPLDMVLDHLCRNRACCNPSHLEIVTHRENVLRGISPHAENARRTHCDKGHPLSGENILWRDGHRHCRICWKAGAAIAQRKHDNTPRGRDSKRARDRKRLAALKADPVAHAAYLAEKRAYFAERQARLTPEQKERQRQQRIEASQRYLAKKKAQ